MPNNSNGWGFKDEKERFYLLDIAKEELKKAITGANGKLSETLSKALKTWTNILTSTKYLKL